MPLSPKVQKLRRQANKLESPSVPDLGRMAFDYTLSGKLGCGLVDLYAMIFTLPNPGLSCVCRGNS